jgi:thiamine monophosphate synthase
VSEPTLLAITPGDGRDLFPWIGALAEAGLTDLLLRERQRDEETIRRLYAFARQHIPRVWVHHHTARALAEAPEHLHLSSDVRNDHTESLTCRFGVSAHTDAQIDRALEAGASYVLFSPVYRPTSKPNDTRAPLGEEVYLRRALGQPVWALGGLSPDRWRRLTSAGATGAAVLGDLFGQASPQQAAERLRSYSGLVASSSSEPVTKTSGS